MLHSPERLLQVWSCEEVYNSLLDIVGPSSIAEIIEDGIRLETPAQRIGEMDTLVTCVHASAAESNVE